MKKQEKSRVIDSSFKVKLYDPMNSLLYAMLGGEFNFRKRLIDHASLKKGDMVLDVGCATGANTIAFHKYSNIPLKIYPLDAAFNMIRYVKKKTSRTKKCFPVQSFAEAMPFPDNCFDMVINVFFLHHMSFELKIKALMEMRRVLKKGGQLITVDPAEPYNLMGKFLAFTRCYINEIMDSLQQPLSQLVEKAGFVEAQTFDRKLGIFSFVGAKKK